MTFKLELKEEGHKKHRKITLLRDTIRIVKVKKGLRGRRVKTESRFGYKNINILPPGIPGDDDSKRPSRAQQQSLNAECILSKEQLYDMFQQILGVKKFEHQLLFNALLVSATTQMLVTHTNTEHQQSNR